MDADTNNGTNEKIDPKIEPVAKKDEVKLSSNTLNDKFSLDLLTPKFAHKLLEKSNVVTPKLDDAEKAARKNEENRAEGKKFTLPNSNLKYRYTEGQWSPINPDGAKRYDREFLMQLQYDPKSKVRPDNIFHDILRSEILPLIGNFLRQSINFDSGFIKNTSQRGGRGSQHGRTPMKPSNSMGKPGVIHVSLKREDVKLNESDNAWKPTRRNAASTTEDENKTEELYKNVRAILNKLTPQKFEALLGQIKGLDIGNQERLEGVIDLVFEKAIDEPNFCVAYAAMCKELALMQVPANNPTKEQPCVNFRSLIIRRCQERFQKTEEEEKRILKERDEMVGDDEVKLRFLEEESRKIRWKSVGNIRFIGELYKHNMLTTKIMNHCIQTLVSDTDEQKLECLCKLLTTIGKVLEAATKLDPYFKIMKDMVDRKINKGISSRVRFMLQDVIDLRARHWVTKHKDAPRTMDEIQKEADDEQRHIQIMNAAPPPRKEDNRNLKRGGRSASTNAIDNNDWQTPRSASHRFTVDSSKLKTININSNVDNVKLGPANMTSWNRGSGAKTASLRQANPTPLMPLTSNMYGLLANMNNDNGPPIRNDMFTPNKNTGINPKENERPAYKNVSTPAPTIARADPTPAPVKQAEPEQMAPEKIKLLIMASIDEYFLMNNLKEVAMDVTQRVNSKDHPVLVAEIFNIVFDKPEKVHDKISNVLSHLVSSKTVSRDNFLTGLEEVLSYAPDLQIDIPLVYSYIATLVTPIVVQNGFSLRQVFDVSKPILEAKHGGRLLGPILRRFVDNWGKNFTKSKWIESGLTLQQWIETDQTESFVKDNHLDFLIGDIVTDKDAPKLPFDVVQKKLKELMLMDQSADSIYGWINEFVGESVNENQFIRVLVTSICEQAISMSKLNQERLGKYALILIKYKREKKCELDCLLAIQHLIHKLEHPRGVSLELFQYFYGEHIISVEAFTEWEKTDLEPEGKAVMLKALVSFFTQISECDDDIENDDSGSED